MDGQAGADADPATVVPLVVEALSVLKFALCRKQPSRSLSGHLTMSTPSEIRFESSNPVYDAIQFANNNLRGLNLLDQPPVQTKGLNWRGTQARVYVSPLDNSHADGFLRLTNDGGISLEGSIRVAGHMSNENYNITGVNTFRINDPGPTEGLIFDGTGAKIVVSPLDDSNADGYLRLVNDGGISLESSVRLGGHLTVNNYNVSVNTLQINDPGPTEGLIFTGTQAKVVVSPLDNGNSDGYLRLINDGGISLRAASTWLDI